MGREQLERLLGGGDDTSSAAWLPSAPALLPSSGRRPQPSHSRRSTGACSVSPFAEAWGPPGLARAVQRLALYGGTVRLGQIRTTDGLRVFMLFLAEGSSTLVECTGAGRPRGARHAQTSAEARTVNTLPTVMATVGASDGAVHLRSWAIGRTSGYGL